MQTHLDLEQLARQMRSRGMHSSWNELLDFSESVVGNLVEAYQAVLRSSMPSDSTFPPYFDDLRTLLQEKLGKALVSLTSQEQVAEWELDSSQETYLPFKEGIKTTKLEIE